MNRLAAIALLVASAAHRRARAIFRRISRRARRARSFFCRRSRLRSPASRARRLPLRHDHRRRNHPLRREALRRLHSHLRRHAVLRPRRAPQLQRRARRRRHRAFPGGRHLVPHRRRRHPQIAQAHRRLRRALAPRPPLSPRHRLKSASKQSPSSTISFSSCAWHLTQTHRRF